MRNLEQILTILFRRIPAKSVLRGEVKARSFQQDDFARIAFAYMTGYSQSELLNMWLYYKDAFQIEHENYGMQNNSRDSFCVFDAIFYLVRRQLLVQENQIVCQYTQIQNWRKLTLQLSEDLLICAYCAVTKSPQEMKELGFSWKAVIGHNNQQLNKILKRGISENHFHLYGSAPIFHISWLSLMNNICTNVQKPFAEYDKNRKNTNVRYGSDYEEDSLRIQHYQAAFIRAWLYTKAIGIEQSFPKESMIAMLENPNDMIAYVPELQSFITAQKNSISSSYYDSAELVDYALQGVKDSCEDSNDIFSGERWLLYSCLRAIYKGEYSELEENLFYMYLLLKENLRAELIQSNEKTGFVNFQDYQNRKKKLMDRSIFEQEMVRRAVRDSLLSGNVDSIELRIAPEKTAEKLRKEIRKLDQIIGDPKDKYFYTLHFIKNRDKEYYMGDCIACRHYKLRKESYKIAHAITQLQNETPEYAARVKGIDAASNEIGCRPEVFGSVFRYLKNHVKMIEDKEKRKYVPQLKITYHVGEDFLDVADGLRAIDEAINFLNMDCGDRFGHAIALGINVKEWYESKNNRILISKHDYLDNLAWVYNRMTEFQIQGMDSLKDYIHRKYEYVFYEVYGKYMDDSTIHLILESAQREYHIKGINISLKTEHHSFNIERYYDAWKLRGDDPALYSHGYFLWDTDGAEETNAQVNMKFPKLFESRYKPEVFLMMYYYHYNSDVRREGNRCIEVKIKQDYIEAITLIQKEMQKQVARRGIAIETNPSSNVLISTFKEYIKHPIFNFYNYHLTNDKEALDECAQLSVSINTDDQGVFATSLENEYALLASALEDAVDEDGNFIYKKTMIYEWIDAIRKMGNDQTF